LWLLHDPALIPSTVDAHLARLGNRGGFEMFNEPPGMDKINPVQYVTGILDLHHYAREKGFEGLIVAGGVGNLSRESFTWLEQTIPQLPDDVALGFHDYPYKAQPWDLPWPGSESHEAAMQHLVDIAGPTRQRCCTEFGWHTAPEHVSASDLLRYGHRFNPSGADLQATDEDVYRYLVAKLRFYEAHGITLAMPYQWQDGPSERFIDRYGLHLADGRTPKRQAAALTDWRLAAAR